MLLILYFSSQWSVQNPILTQNSEVQGWSSDWPQVFSIKNSTEYQENPGLFIVPLSGHLRLLLFSHFTLHLIYHIEEKGSLGLQSHCVHTLLPSLSHSVFHILSSVTVIEKHFKKALPDKSGFYYIFSLALFLFQCRLRCLKLWVAKLPLHAFFFWTVLHSLVVLLAFIFFLYRVSSGIKAIRSQNSAR